MAKDLLLEIGTEEIPAGFMPGALESLKACAGDILSSHQVPFAEGRTTVLGTPRRLVLHVPGVEDVIRQPVLGPPRKIALDEQGNYTRAAQGFAKSQKIELEALKFIDDRLGYIKVVEGEAVKSLLAEICREIIEALSFPKTMRWGAGDFSFVRPIHWIVALFGKDVIEFEVAGIKSGNQSRGHRFLKPKPFQVTSADLDSYKAELEKRFVIVDQDERRQLIEQQIQEIVSTSKPGCRALSDAELLEEVNFLVEYPVALCGSFDAEFLELPSEVLINCMRQHQKYFVVENQKGELEAAFVVVSNLPEKTEGLIRSGNERVLRARLADAQFFYQEDQKIRLEDRVENLKGVVFQKDLGSYFDKKERVKQLLAKIVPERLDTELAADLYKADLLTEMVQEFPKLQGIMGEHYANLQGESQEVATAIREHYLPRFAGDNLPQTELGAALSIADKIDSIVGCFGAGFIPSGSQDPYALRRQALGLIYILLYKKWDISLNKLIDLAFLNYAEIFGVTTEKLYKTLVINVKSGRSLRPGEDVLLEVYEFFRQRLHYILAEKGYGSDLVDAALWTAFDYPLEVEARCKALQELQTDKDWEPLVIAFKRVARIIPPERQFGTPDSNLFQEEAEKELWKQFKQKEKIVKAQLAQGYYSTALKELAALRPAVDCFFDEVMVMCEDQQLQNNRLALLNSIAGLFNQLADFSKIVTQAS